MKQFFHRLRYWAGGLMIDPTLSSDQNTLILVVTLLFFGNGFSATFVNTFLYATDGGLKSVIAYNVFNYGGVMCFAGLVAALGRKIGLKNCMFIGMGFFVATYALLLILRERAGEVVWLIGLTMALASSFFYVTHNAIVLARTDNAIRDRYFSRQGIFTTAGNLIAPFVAGYSIALIGGTAGYLCMFALSLVMYLAAGTVALRLGPAAQTGGAKSCFLLTLRLGAKRKNYRDTLIASILRGVREGTMWVLAPTLLFAAADTGLVGVYNLVTSGLLIASLWISQRVLRPDNRSRWLLLSVSMLACSTLVFLLKVNVVTIFTYGILTSLGMAFFNTPTSCIYCNVTSSLPAAGRRSLEGMAIQEMMLNFGRMAAMAVLFALPSIDAVLVGAMIAAGFSQFAVWFFYARAQKYTALPQPAAASQGIGA